MVKISWLKEARDDLKDIFDFISRDSKKYAIRQVDRIFSRTHILRTQVRAGKIVEEINNPEIREIIEGNYRIIYRIVNENSVNIIMVHHSARDLTRRIK